MKKIYLGIVLTVVMALFVVGWAIDQFAAFNMDEKDNDAKIYDSLIRTLAIALDERPETEISAYLKLVSNETSLNFNIEQLDSIALPSSLRDTLDKAEVLSLQTEASIFYLYKLNTHPNTLLSLTVQNTNEETSYVNLALTLSLYIGISIALIAWLLPLTRRLSTLDATADAFGKGKLDSRIKPVSWSYISSIEKNFNRMATQIEKLVADNKMLAGSLSHDLRTPLSCLRFGIEAVKDCDSVAEQASIFERIDDELNRMEAMLDAFLNYASMERQGINLNLSNVDIGQLLMDLQAELSPLAQSKGIEIKIHREMDIAIEVDRHWLGRAIMNLISNAIDYAKTEITVEASCSHSRFTLSVKDDGEGIQESAIQTIFEPFTKGDSARNRASNKFGLGLAIVKRVVEWHNGQVKAANIAAKNGACFSFSIPLQQGNAT
ncbi:sensor histidine kinase [Agaribacter flavus]|uniref:histidine kinase n=1 Tax=Agaribacter flavus TaxID=1902781 RepID=A0ABV7FKQ7_9ALTE